MADAKLTALTAASALAGADLFYISQGGVSKKATHTQLLTLVGTTYVPLAGGEMTGALTIASGTLTASAPALDVTQTWNNSGVTFTGLKLNVTNTASGGSSLLADLQIGGASLFSVRKDGVVTTTAGFVTTGGFSGFTARDDNGFFIIGTSSDVRLNRDSAGMLALRLGATQQGFRVYNTHTDASNYERLTLTGVAGTSVNITAESAGTGSANLHINITPKGTGRVRIGNTTCNVDTSGNIEANALYILAGATGYWSNNTMQIKSSAMFSWSSTTTGTASTDTAFHRGAAGQIDVTNGTAGTWRDLKLRNNLRSDHVGFREIGVVCHAVVLEPRDI